MTITLKNYGVAPATAISGSLTSPTSGVTVALPNSRRSRISRRWPRRPTAARCCSRPRPMSGVPAPRTSRSPRATPVAPDRCRRRSRYRLASPRSASPRTSTAPRLASATGVVGSTGVQNFRLNRQDAASVCGVQKPAPPISAGGGPGARRYDAYAFTTCGFSTPSCASVTFSGPNSINMFSAAYAPTFNPADITQNYKADPAVSSSGAADLLVRSAGRQQPVRDRRARRAGARRTVQQSVHR